MGQVQYGQLDKMASQINDIVGSIKDQIESTANARVVFGDPVKESGTTIIPVAKTDVKGGGGGGVGEAGKAKSEKGTGMGIGLSIKTTPMGYIKIKDGHVQYEDIIDKNKLIMGGAIIGGLLLFMLGRRK